MNAEELLKRIIELGADEAGIKDRFLDDAQLYEECLREFINNKSFGILDEAIKAGDYSRAFDAAHALKGLSGNMGLTGYYDAICVLTEALRESSLDHIAPAYLEAGRQMNIIKSILNGEEHDEIPPEELQPQGQAHIPAHKANDRERDKQPEMFFLVATVVTVCVLLITLFALYMLNKNYEERIRYESGEHLKETGNQIGQFIEEQLRNDWKIAESLKSSIVNINYYDDEAILNFLQEQIDTWGITTIMLYTDNGYCTYADGQSVPNGISSEIIASAEKDGSLISIIKSEIVYTLPIETRQRYNGSPIVAVSVVHNLETLLDEMKIDSFENEAWIYLVEENGIVISMLTGNEAVVTFNINSLLDEMNISSLTSDTKVEDIFSTAISSAYFSYDGEEQKYIVSVPISTDETDEIRMRLFYIIPELVVNESMQGFSTRLAFYSVLVICIFVLLTMLLFISLYQSRKKKFNEAISAREHMLDLMIKNMHTVFGLFNTNRREPIYISGNAEEIIGEKNWSIEKYGSGFALRGTINNDSEMLQKINEKLCDWDGRNIFKSGYICDNKRVPPDYFEMTLYPSDDGDSNIVGILQDMTSAYHKEEATKNALEMARSSNEAKSRFLANMSHDIRTPMNAIMNMASFSLEESQDSKKLSEYLKTIYNSSQHLLHLINDILDMSRIESGQAVIASQPFNLVTEMQKQIEILKPLYEGKKQQLIVNLSGVYKETVQGDAVKVSQIVMNLLSNAAKFTPDGGTISLTALEVPSLRDDMVNIRFIVEDNGIGISHKDMDNIFSPFARAENKTVAQIEGTGLGLSICKSYAEAMGGTISCQSEVNKGSKFTVELFFQKAAALQFSETHVRKDYGSMPFKGMRCLVVEDNYVNQTIAKTLLVRVGFTVDIASDGGEGTDMFLHAEPGTYDVIYLDVQMPVLNGYEAANRIRESDHPQATDIPILAMSANVFVEDIEKARIVGMDGYISKPVLSADLVEQTMKVMKMRRGEGYEENI